MSECWRFNVLSTTRVIFTGKLVVVVVVVVVIVVCFLFFNSSKKKEEVFCVCYFPL